MPGLLSDSMQAQPLNLNAYDETRMRHHTCTAGACCTAGAWVLRQAGLPKPVLQPATCRIARGSLFSRTVRILCRTERNPHRICPWRQRRGPSKARCCCPRHALARRSRRRCHLLTCYIVWDIFYARAQRLLPLRHWPRRLCDGRGLSEARAGGAHAAHATAPSQRLRMCCKHQAFDGLETPRLRTEYPSRTDDSIRFYSNRRSTAWPRKSLSIRFL